MAKRSVKATTKPFVLDGSVALAWCFPDEAATYPQAVLNSMAICPAIVPSLWHLEIANALRTGERRKRCTEADTIAWLGFLAALPIDTDPETSLRAWSDTLHLARAHDLTTYDAAYLELALRLGAPLATLDDKLQAAAIDVGVTSYTP